jgi:sugar lactone lactonase YvrE
MKKAIAFLFLAVSVLIGCRGSSGPAIGTWAGDGTQGYDGGGLVLTESWFNQPMELAFGPDGYAYIVDWNNHRIRRVKIDNTIESVIGTDLPGDWPCQNPSDPADCEVPLDGTIDGTNLSLNHPMDIAFAGDGTAYIAAWHNHKVLRYDLATGIVSITAGGQQPGFSGDNGPAAGALLNFPASLVVDAFGNIFVSDERSNRIRRIADDADRTITTVAGSSSPPSASGYAGDGGPATSALLALTAHDELGGADNPPPGGGLAMGEDGSLYVADTFNHCIRKIVPGSDGVIGEGDPAEEIITTVAGTCTVGGSSDGSFNGPYDLDFGPDGRLYVADAGNHLVQAIDLSTGLVEAVAGTGEGGFSGDGGLPTEAKLQEPYGIAFDTEGLLYIVDTLNNRIRLVSQGSAGEGEGGGDEDESCADSTGALDVTGASGTIATIAGSGAKATDDEDADSDGVVDCSIPALEATFDAPIDITFGPDGRLYILDWNGHKIRALGGDGLIAFIAGTGFEGDACESPNPDGTCPAIFAQINHMTDLVFDAEGRMVIAAWHNAKIKRVDLGTELMEDLCGTGNRQFAGDGGPCESGGVDLVSFDLPSSVVYDQERNLFITDQANQVIRRIGTDGVVSTVVGNCPGEEGRFGCPAAQGYSGDDGPATSAKLHNKLGQGTDPQGKITMDADGSLYIADTANNLIRKVVPGSDGIIGEGDPNEEIITRVAGIVLAGYSGDNGPATLAMLKGPRDVKVAPDGTIYFADTLNHCVREIAPDGIISTVAGRCGGSGGFAGDGGLATEATLNSPYGIDLDGNGNLYIADTLNNRIRVVYK